MSSNSIDHISITSETFDTLLDLVKRSFFTQVEIITYLIIDLKWSNWKRIYHNQQNISNSYLGLYHNLFTTWSNHDKYSMFHSFLDKKSLNYKFWSFLFCFIFFVPSFKRKSEECHNDFWQLHHWHPNKNADKASDSSPATFNGKSSGVRNDLVSIIDMSE